MLKGERTMLRRTLIMSVGVVGCIMTPSAARAQAWIGQVVGDMVANAAAAERERKCMLGEAMLPDEVAEARSPADRLVADYWRTVASGDSVDVSALFQADTKSRWISPSGTVTQAGLVRVTDPFASAGAAIDPTPLAFFRAGDASSAAGQWVARRPDGTVVATYAAQFRRSLGNWKLSQFEVSSADTVVDPLVQYCHQPDDVMPYRLTSAAATRGYAEKRATKLQAKALQAKASADGAAEAVASAKPGSRDARATKAATLAQSAEAAARKADEAAAVLAEAIKVDEKAKADNAAVESAKTDARAKKAAKLAARA